MVTATAIALIGSAAGVAAAQTAPGPAGSAPAAASGPPSPSGLTVEVIGGGTPADERSAIDYTIELRDDGPLPYRHLAVTALLPSGFHVLRASPEPGQSAAVPTWTVDVAPGQKVDIRAQVSAGTVQDLTDGTPIPLADAPDDLVDPSAPGAQAWYSVTACVRQAPGDPPVTCGLSSQLLVKTEDDTRRGVEAIVLLLGLPAAAAGLGAYAWRTRRDPEADP
ncbi:hypothetical protein GCM10009838_01610 [Catenulispora subtropica]|uniref:DUF11 domain-containing protein n=1 Tax=Catenulispora subtropica TaxID=450798 RepID=A0ABN2QDH9_9ACTN